jgi:hypothetical protein
MAPTPHRIAQTSTELKKQYKQSGPRLNDRQQKQLERDSELDQRAVRAREIEERRKAAKIKRAEKEAKEARARKQIGVGLATQLIGYSHTQAQLKNGMEAFLGVKKRKEEENRKQEMELTKKLEAIADVMDKEPWDDDDDDDMVIDLPESNQSSGDQWAEDGLDDDSLLEAHDMLMSDPVEEPQAVAQPPPVPKPVPPVTLAPLVAPKPTTAQKNPSVPPTLPKPLVQKDAPDFIRTHGPINKAIEAVLDKLPEPLIELLSQDMSLKAPEWDPPHGLLHKLNPVALPPHRLRVKVGCVVSLLRDLNTSSQLSKSQHLRVLRCQNDRLECQVLDGQLEGTKTFLTRVPFHARYRNLEEHLFQRTQFPIRVATDYTPSSLVRDTSQTGFKLPSIPGRVPPAGLVRKPTPPVAKAKPPANSKPGFKLPALPASKSSSSLPPKPISSNMPTPSISQSLTDGWDDFFESSTQVSRELASETVQKAAAPTKLPVAVPKTADNCLPVMSTQDLDFSMEDLHDEPAPVPERRVQDPTTPYPVQRPARPMPKPLPTRSAVYPPALNRAKPAPVQGPAKSPPTKPAQTTAKTVSKLPPAKHVVPLPVQNRVTTVHALPVAKANVPVYARCLEKELAAPLPVDQKAPPKQEVITVKMMKNRQKSTANSSKPLTWGSRKMPWELNPGPLAAQGVLQAELAKLRASQLPKTFSAVAAKRKNAHTPSPGPPKPAKRQCVEPSRPVLPAKSAAASSSSASFEEFGLSTQDAASFFEDDESMSFGSPPLFT